MTDDLRDSLRDLAGTVEPADLYDGAVRRSRRIARREAAVGTGAALIMLALLASGLWRLPSGDSKEPSVAQRSSAPPSAKPLPHPTLSVPRFTPEPTRNASSGRTSAPPRRRNQPQATESSATPESRALADLPGRVFYQQPGPEPAVVRMSPADGDVQTVLPKAPSAVGVSPDGNKLAYAVDGALVVDPDGGTPQQVATGVSTADQPPAWAPDGDHLLVTAGTPAILQVGSGTLTPLAEQLATGQHFRWSGDGTTLVYATSYCSLKVAAGDSDTAVPVIGDRQPVDNPDGLAACKPTSVDATGQRVTVPLQVTGETGADSPDTADAVVDTVTGEVVPLAVPGTVVGAFFNPDGNLLVRSRKGAKTTLSLFAPDGRLLVQAKEPAELRDLNLLAYTR